MTRSIEEEIDLQSARRYLYALGQLLLGSEPTIERLEGADADLLAEALEICGLADDHGLAEGLAALRQDIDGACALYMRLFIGPATPEAMPWESTYRSNSKALFRQETLAVRNAYRAQGLIPQCYPKVADDHIAIELGFMAALAGRMLEGLQRGDAAFATGARQASRAFLDEHLARWINAYADDLEAAAPGTAYAAAARIASELVGRDATLLEEGA